MPKLAATFLVMFEFIFLSVQIRCEFCNSGNPFWQDCYNTFLETNISQDRLKSAQRMGISNTNFTISPFHNMFNGFY